MNCPQCQELLKDSARFCSNCGLSFISINTPTQRVDISVESETLSQFDPLIGQVLDSKYELLSRLGAGGMGAVYRARRTLIGDEVAIKVLLKQFVADSEASERFRREARAAAMLRHPNVVTIHDFGEARGDDAPAYIVMELVEGESLGDLLRREGRLETERAVSLMRDICAGVGAAHRRHIWHRDLKPDNVIVLAADEDRERETGKVVDFGIAKLRDLSSGPTLTQTGVVMGTPYYMSPEQCRGESLDARSDVYSLGAMLHEMLDGAPPFIANNSTGVIAKHLTEKPLPLSKDLGVTPELEAVMMRALAKDPDKRPQDASAFTRELQAALRSSDTPLPMHIGETDVSSSPQLSQLSSRPDHPAQGQQTKRSSESVTLSSSGLSTEPNTISKQELTSGVATSSKLRGSRAPFVLGIAALLIIIIGGVVVWMMRTGENKSQPSANKEISPRQQASEKASEPTVPARMAKVAGGEFMMGRDGDATGYESPAHKVTVKPFFIDIYEVTREDYKKCFDAGKCPLPQGWINGNYPEGTARRPATGVTWDAANAYAKWAGKRLPTEEEWEFAARGTDGRRYPWGNEWSAELANADHPSGGIVDVGTYKGASPFGAFDMVGNAWEWTASNLAAYPGGQLPKQTLPGELRVICGGSYASAKDNATVTYRRGYPARGDYDYNNTGFRCVKEITP